MNTPFPDLVIRPATPDDIAAIYALCAKCLTLDTFSSELIEQKLFTNPRPDLDAYAIFLAEHEGRVVGVMQSIIRASERRAWLGIFAVDPAYRRHRIATRLFDEVLPTWQTAGTTLAEVLAIPGNYFNPGLDPRYTPALAFLERRGFSRFKDCANLICDLTTLADIDEDEKRLDHLGVEIRRAEAADAPLIDAYFKQHFGEGWRTEVGLAMAVSPPALHLALRDDRIIAFSAHSTQNTEWGFFGPMGTAPESRGLGVGRVLLLRCLHDLRDAGHRTAVIPWVGPIAFYAHHADCKVDRVFWRYQKNLLPTP